MKTTTRISLTTPATTLLLASLLGFFPTATRAETAVQAWVQRYNIPVNAEVSAKAVVRDHAGNIILAGATQPGNSGVAMPVAFASPGLSPTTAPGGDMLIIKYSSVGVPLWINRYHGLQSGSSASALAVDGSNNVIMTGNSDNGTNTDYITIKYSSAGVPLWTNCYNGPGNGWDYTTALAVDGSANVIVTGYSWGSGSSYDYATIQYSSAGVPLWTNRYNGPGNGHDRANAVAVDGSNNVIVTVDSNNGTTSDYATIKYSNAGVPLWTNLYNGPANSYDYAQAMAVDGSNNVIVTGYSYNGTNNDYATIQYSSIGLPVWTNRYDGQANPPHYGDDCAQAVAVDGSNNVIVTGYSHNGTNTDYATIKYSSAGEPFWTKRYNGPGDDDDHANAMAVDSDDNVVVTGHSASTNLYPYNFDYATIQYSSAGMPLWTNRYNGLGNGDAHAQAVTVDASNNVIVTGDFLNETYLATIQYSSAGVSLWTNRYSEPGNGDDHFLYRSA